jgi:hypothetical protein
VDSDSTVKLISKAVSIMSADRSVGRAEAMHRSMLALIEIGEREAHPAYWAPFVVVGEGSAEPIGLTTSSIVPPAEIQSAKPKPRPNRKATPADWKAEIWRR